ncbi:uncharacterized protein H6S33_012506 [Morchella sextelata]|nr:uncharacterized protein H6S33_012506 [Morchella sextelata]KAH0609960.1 hypothetical protein H6S33_012506 [Morchella sextelata]
MLSRLTLSRRNVLSPETTTYLLDAPGALATPQEAFCPLLNLSDDSWAYH